jgi:hypothetical protein
MSLNVNEKKATSEPASTKDKNNNTTKKQLRKSPCIDRAINFSEPYP